MDAGETGVLQTAQTLPFVLFAIPAGILADRLSRRGVMAVRRGAARGARGRRWRSRARPAELAAAGGARLRSAPAEPSRSASRRPRWCRPWCRRSALAAANARIELARTVAFAAGPALGGALVGWAGGAAAFGVAAALSAGAVVLLSGVREPAPPPRPPRHLLDDVREGARFMFRHPLLRPIFVTQFVFNTAFFVLQAVFVPYAVRRLGLSASGVGLTLATYGVGMVVGALLAGRVMRGCRSAP